MLDTGNIADYAASPHTNSAPAPLSLPHSTDPATEPPDPARRGIFDPQPFNAVRGEMALWQAVITQALMDASCNSHKYEAKLEKLKATRWLLGGSKDFVTVCYHAGLEPSYVREKIRLALSRNCRWRADAAENFPAAD